MIPLKLTALALLCAVSFVNGLETKDKRQVGSGSTSVTTQPDDHQGAATAFFGGPTASINAGGKYFQYAHVPAKDHYEHGHKRGNEHHFIERHEKGHPHAGEFKTKVRWGDKHGGYGEHYWDYNHDGHDHGDGEETQQNEEYAAYEETKEAPKYTSVKSVRGKRQPTTNSAFNYNDDDVEFISSDARSFIVDGLTGRHGGNYRQATSLVDSERGKREQQSRGGKDSVKSKINGKDLVFDSGLGIIVDERTGIKYQLRPVDY